MQSSASRKCSLWLLLLSVVGAACVYQQGAINASESPRPSEPREQVRETLAAYADDVFDKKISVDFRKARLKEVLDDISEKAGLLFAWKWAAGAGFEWNYSADAVKVGDVIGRL